jgi:hypothetical protein
VQCFPIPPRGGRLKIRLGITAPLVVESMSQAALRLPCFAERNFAIGQNFEHSFWLETPARPAGRLSRLVLDTSKPGKIGAHGQMTDAELNSPHFALHFPISSQLLLVRSRDSKSQPPQFITQALEPAQAEMPERLAIVLDGSVQMTPFLPEIARALEGLPAQLDLAIWFVQDGLSQIYRKDWKTGDPASAAVGRLRGIGGQDNVPALLEAWEWAVAKPGGAVLWVHGPQPILLGNLEGLKQRLEWRGSEGPAIIDVATRPGPNRIAEHLARFDALAALPRMGELGEDLGRLFAKWNGRSTEFRFNRTAEPAPSVENRRTGGAAASHPPEADATRGGLAAGIGTGMAATASSHLVRLWARDQIHWLIRIRQVSKAVELAARYQLVTPVSGAVVLETAQQFAEAGLTPADPLTVPSVPEPGTWLLVILASIVLLLHRKIAPAWKVFMKDANTRPSHDQQ